MNDTTVLQIGRDTLTMMILLMTPPMMVALVVGLVISILQAATQVQEMTLSFVPKIIAVFASLVLFGPWLLTQMMTFTHRLLSDFPAIIGR